MLHDFLANSVCVALNFTIYSQEMDSEEREEGNRKRTRRDPSDATNDPDSMDHTAGTYVFDASGKVRLFVRYGSGAEALRHDLKLLLDEDPG